MSSKLVTATLDVDKAAEIKQFCRDEAINFSRKTQLMWEEFIGEYTNKDNN